MELNLKFQKNHPECPLKNSYWISQWGYLDGKAGVWCKENLSDKRIYPIFLDKLSEALEFIVLND